MCWNLNSLLIFSVVILLANYVSARRPPPFNLGRMRFGNMGEPAPALPPNANLNVVGDQWLWQYVDNFNYTNTNLWPNRYLINAEFYEKGGPIFLMLRGESPISKNFMLSGAWIQYAQRFGALCFQLEHRYYGKSFPTKDMSTDNLKFLTSKQAIADAASFIQTMNKLHNFTADQQWIIFGGSYAGALAMWLVEDYPNLAYGAVSSSGPVYATLDFGGYFELVANVIQDSSFDCLMEIRKGFATIRQMVTTDEGKTELNSVLNLCDDLSEGSQLDVSNLLLTLSNAFSSIVQYDKVPTPGNTISVHNICEIMLNKTIGTSLDRVAHISGLVLGQQDESCLSFTYQSTLDYLREISNNNSLGGDRQWWYQVCNEFGYFQTTNNNRSQVFGNEFSLNFYTQQCIDVFGPHFSKNTLSRKVFETNIYYGGYKPSVQNVISVQGSIDPWHLLGITRNVSHKIEAVLINGTGHCADIYAPSSHDIPALKEARVKITTFLEKLLPNVTENPVSSSTSSSSRVISGEASDIADEITAHKQPMPLFGPSRPSKWVTRKHPLPPRPHMPYKRILKNGIKYLIEMYGSIKVVEWLLK